VPRRHIRVARSPRWPPTWAYLDAARPSLLDTGAEQIAEALASLLPPVDRAAVTGALAEDVVAGFSAALAPGVEGWLDDDLAFTQGWGFELTSLAAVPVSLWQGDLDLMVPPAHGRWLAREIPHARVHLLPQDGHLSITVGRLGDVLDELLLPP
jgi:pimeloyl-ACP methyl ester carboxylesterase